MTVEGIAYRHIKRPHAVQCKCPVCGKTHTVKMTAVPEVMPRVYCRVHAWRRMAYEYCG